MSRCVKCRITGLVQGVFFRDSTRQKAIQYNITGHAINLPDGSVEVLACGESEELSKLKAWLHDGPSHARVDNVECQVTDCECPSIFSTG